MRHKLISEIDTLRLRALNYEIAAITIQLQRDQLILEKKQAEMRALHIRLGVDPDREGVLLLSGDHPAGTVVDRDTGEPVRDESSVGEG